MSKRIALFSGLVVAGIMLAACGAPSAASVPPTKAPEAMMEKTPDKMMEKTPDTMMKETPDTMTDKTPEAMMNKTPHAVMDATPDAMMEKTPDAMMEKTPDAMMTTPDAMMDKTPESMMEMPGWFGANLTNAATGETFTIQDLKGKVVLVETMAMWCPTCLSQGKEVKALHEQLGERSDFQSVGIDVDINENLAGLKDYTAKNGFDWTYTVANADVARELGERYGQQFLNPPSAPMFIIDRHGEVHPLPFGVKSAADLQKALEPFLNEAM
jgi:peroxiredoxin